MTRCALLLVVGVVVGSASLGGCSASSAAAKGPVVKTIHLFQQKVEIAEALKRMAAAYEAERPGVRFVVESFGGGQDSDTLLFDRSLSGNLPDVFMARGEKNFDQWASVAEDLSDQPWVGDLEPGTVDPVTRNGRIYGNPVAIEGYGFLYNKALFRKAGILQPPNTLQSLAEACRRLKAAGILPFSNGYAEWWVLGVHNFNLLLGSVAHHDRFVAALASEAEPGPDAAVVEGWMNLLDLTVRYGIPDAAVSGTYTVSVAAFLSSQAAMIQQGNWIEPDLLKSAPDLEVGVLPMPVSDHPDDRLAMGVPNFWIVNKASPVKEEVKAWLEWLHSSPTGRRFLLQELRTIPPYRSLASQPLGVLSAPFAAAWRQGRTLPWLFPRYEDKTKAVAAAMRFYLEHRQTHREFWHALVRAWRNP